jgi:hypothetical protein
MSAAWPKTELRKIADTHDLHISPFRDDGKTFGTPTWIWPVVVDDQLYVRAYNQRHAPDGAKIRPLRSHAALDRAIRQRFLSAVQRNPGLEVETFRVN